MNTKRYRQKRAKENEEVNASDTKAFHCRTLSESRQLKEAGGVEEPKVEVGKKLKNRLLTEQEWKIGERRRRGRAALKDG